MVATTTNPPITYHWWFKEAALDAVANPSVAKSVLSLTNVTLVDGGPYFVVVSDTSGSVTSQIATLTVDPTFSKITTGPGEPLADLSICMSWWDYDRDGFLDLFVANGYIFGSSVNRLYHNDHDSSGRRSPCGRT